MEPTAFLLTGYPGVGKYTVGKALVEHLRASGDMALLVDNHWINNPILGLIEQDGITPLPTVVWHYIAGVREAVFSTLQELTPRTWHIVFTAFIDDSKDLPFIARLEALAEIRGSRFVPVRLSCRLDENSRRIVSPDRRERMKWVDPQAPYRLAESNIAYEPAHPNALTLDVTEKSPAEAAAAIATHATTLPDPTT